MPSKSESEGRRTYVEHASTEAFAATLARLEAAITSAGMTIFAHIDHAAGAHAVGLAMPPTSVLIYGNPRGGTPIMLAAPHAALDLPLRILVRENMEGEVFIAIHPIATVMQEAGVAGDLVDRLEGAQTAVLRKLLLKNMP